MSNAIDNMSKYHHKEGPRSRTSGALGLLIAASMLAVVAVAIASFIERMAV
jgi:hypothetical protein